MFLQYVETKRRSAYWTVLEVSMPNQIQSKVQKVTGGLTAQLTTLSTYHRKTATGRAEKEKNGTDRKS